MFIAKRAPIAPAYGTLGDVRIILDATGLRDGANNSYGQVTGGVVQVWKSISPSSLTGATFSAASVGTPGESSTLKFLNGYVEFPGYTILSSDDIASTFDFLSFKSPATNLKSTVHVVCKIGQNDNPNTIYALFGSGAGSGGNKGTTTSYDDRVSVPHSDGIRSILGAGGVTIISGTPENLITPNVPFVYTEETDLSQSAANRRKFYINGVQFAHSVTSASTSVVTNPSYALNIGAGGNKYSPFRGWISHVIIQDRVESSGTMTAFVNSLLPYTRKTTSRYFYDVDESRTYGVYHTLNAAGRYYFVQGLLQDPTNPNTVLKIFHDGDAHAEADDKKVACQKSTDMGRTWAAQFNVFDPSGTEAVQDGEWGWSSDGVVHGLIDTHTEIALPGSTNKLYYVTSTDALTSTTVTDITAQVPSDGRGTWRAHGNIIEIGSFLYACLYKQTAEDSNVDTAVYLARKPLGAGTTWTFFLVDDALSATLYLNEQSIAQIGNDAIIMMVRNETTEEYRQYRITDISTTPSVTDDGDQSFGETFAFGGPPLLSSFLMNGSRVVANWMLDRNNQIIKVVYGTAANLLASASGWDMDTKITIVDDTQQLHYGRILHYNNTFNAIAAFAREPNPFTATENTLVTMNMPSTNYFNVKAQLGL